MHCIVRRHGRALNFLRLYQSANVLKSSRWLTAKRAAIFALLSPCVSALTVFVVRVNFIRSKFDSIPSSCRVPCDLLRLSFAIVFVNIEYCIEFNSNSGRTLVAVRRCICSQKKNRLYLREKLCTCFAWFVCTLVCSSIIHKTNFEP